MLTNFLRGVRLWRNNREIKKMQGNLATCINMQPNNNHYQNAQQLIPVIREQIQSLQCQALQIQDFGKVIEDPNPNVVRKLIKDQDTTSSVVAVLQGMIQELQQQPESSLTVDEILDLMNDKVKSEARTEPQGVGFC